MINEFEPIWALELLIRCFRSLVSACRLLSNLIQFESVLRLISFARVHFVFVYYHWKIITITIIIIIIAVVVGAIDSASKDLSLHDSRIDAGERYKTRRRRINFEFEFEFDVSKFPGFEASRLRLGFEWLSISSVSISSGHRTDVACELRADC